MPITDELAQNLIFALRLACDAAEGMEVSDAQVAGWRLLAKQAEIAVDISLAQTEPPDPTVIL